MVIDCTGQLEVNLLPKRQSQGSAFFDIFIYPELVEMPALQPHAQGSVKRAFPFQFPRKVTIVAQTGESEYIEES